MKTETHTEAHIERRIITGLILSTEYIEKIEPLLKIKWLKSEESKRIANWCITHYKKYKIAPNKEIQNIYIDKLSSLNEEAAALIEDTLLSLSKEFKRKKSNINIDYLIDETEKYLKKRQLQDLIDTAQEELNNDELLEATTTAATFQPIQRIQSNGVIPLGTPTSIRTTYEDQFNPLFHYGDTPLGHMLNRSLCRGCFVSILAQNKGGKALRNGTPVLTNKGWKPIEDMNIGDTIFNKQGQKKEVLGVYPQGINKCYRFTFNDGSWIDSDSEHIWALQTYSQRFDKRTPSYKKLVNMTTNEIVKRYGIGDIKDSSKRPLFPSNLKVMFSKKKILIDPYILGVLLGDGCFMGAMPSISTPDIGIVNSFKKAGYLLTESCNNTYYIKTKPENVKVKEFTNSINVTVPKHKRFINKPKEHLRLKTHLKRLKLWGKLSIEKHIPKEYLFNTSRVRLEILRGVMDTDGCISSCGRTISFSSSSKQLAKDVMFLVRSLGGRVSVSSKIPKFTYKGEKKTGQRSYRLTIKTDIKVFKLKKKLERQRVYKKTNERILYKIKDIGKHKTTCITTSDKDGLFITKDFIVTHNSFTLMDMGMKAIQNNLKVAYFQAGDMSRKQQERRQGIWLVKKSDLPEYCNTLYIPVLDCVYNQNGECDLPQRESDFYPFENYTDKQIRGEAETNNITTNELKERVNENRNHKPCYNCIRGIGKHTNNFKGTIWYRKRKPVEPLTWKEVYKVVNKGFHKKLKNMRLITYGTDTLTVSMIKQELDILEKQGFIADVVLIDYMDILAPDSDTKTLSLRDQENKKWARMRALSIEKNNLIIAPTQADSKSFKQKVLNKTNFSEDKRKLDHVTAMFGLNMSDIEKVKGVARYNSIVDRDTEGAKIVHVMQRLQIGRPILGSFY